MKAVVFHKPGVHGFPGMWTGARYWWDWPKDWHGWPAKIAEIEGCANGRAIWISETGYATCQYDSGKPDGYMEPSKWLFRAIMAPVERLYWYCVRDMSSGMLVSR